MSRTRRQRDPTDLYIGRRIQQRRTSLRISRAALGATVGLTGQRIQDYENGIVRIPANDLVALSNALDIPVRHFFELSAIVLIEMASETAGCGALQ